VIGRTATVTGSSARDGIQRSVRAVGVAPYRATPDSRANGRFWAIAPPLNRREKSLNGREQL
jgi:hypothetical protein